MDHAFPHPDYHPEAGPSAYAPRIAARDHAGALHPTGRPGTVSIARKREDYRWEERAYRVNDLAEVIPAMAGENDIYISTQRFWGWRRISRLGELGALAVDVDFYKVPELAEARPLGVLEDALVALQRQQMPEPSLAIASGRGLVLYWLHGAVPRQALPRWNACQKALYDALRPLGADRGALDAARVLRLAGTRHGGAGVMVETLRGGGEVWSFDDLAAEVLPLDRAELHDLRVQRARRKPSPGRPVAPQGYTAGTLHEARLRDLQRLKELRWFGDLPPGHRDEWMFVAGVSMSWLAQPVVLQRELWSLAHEVGGWSGAEAASRLQAVMRRAHMAARGERVEYAGAMVDARYRLRSQTILERLEITPDEEKEMKTIISADEARRRDRERKRADYRNAGMQERSVYEAGALARQREPVILKGRSEGKSIKRISRETGIPRSEVQRLIKRIDTGGPESIPLYGGLASRREHAGASEELRGNSPETQQTGESRAPEPPSGERGARESGVDAAFEMSFSGDDDGPDGHQPDIDVFPWIEIPARSPDERHGPPAEVLEDAERFAALMELRSQLPQALVLASSADHGDPSAREEPDWRNHPLACKCDACIYPEPRYAKPYRYIPRSA